MGARDGPGLVYRVFARFYLLFAGSYLAATEAGIEMAHNPNLFCAKTKYFE
jgi:hypothetical protein